MNVHERACMCVCVCGRGKQLNCVFVFYKVQKKKNASSCHGDIILIFIILHMVSASFIIIWYCYIKMRAVFKSDFVSQTCFGTLVAFLYSTVATLLIDSLTLDSFPTCIFTDKTENREAINSFLTIRRWFPTIHSVQIPNSELLPEHRKTHGHEAIFYIKAGSSFNVPAGVGAETGGAWRVHDEGLARGVLPCVSE